MLTRVLEPEVMDSREEAVAYNAMDHDAVNQKFVDDLTRCGELGQDCLDVGTGTAWIPVLFVQSQSYYPSDGLGCFGRNAGSSSIQS